MKPPLILDSYSFFSNINDVLKIVDVCGLKGFTCQYHTYSTFSVNNIWDLNFKRLIKFKDAKKGKSIFRPNIYIYIYNYLLNFNEITHLFLCFSGKYEIYSSEFHKKGKRFNFWQFWSVFKYIIYLLWQLLFIHFVKWDIFCIFKNAN